MGCRGENGPSEPNCVGITNVVWGGRKVEFNFDSGYGQAPPNQVWWLSPGDLYAVGVKGAIFQATVP